MARLSSFEDIEAWQKARELYQRVLQMSAKPSFRDLKLRDQLRSAAVSAVSNIAEGFERGGNKEFHQFLAVAKGSVGEVKAQLYLALDAGYVSAEEFQQARAIANSAERLIGGFMRYLRNSDKRGPKFV